jgi:outer membrane protein TolC
VGCPALGPDLFAAAAELDVEALVSQVLDRNPSLPQMVAAWQAASARYPQVTSLDDPYFGATLAPASFGSSDVAAGYRLEYFQRFPFPGKLRLRGENAAAEASAAGRDVENVRQQLVEAARDAFYQFFLIDRALEVNQEALRLLREFEKNAETRYTTAQGAQQDVLLARVEIGRQRERRIILERQRQVALARINTLLHLPPDSPLPPPPRDIRVEDGLPDVRELRERALSGRLDLLALKDRIAAAQASVQLAYKEYCPDFDVTAAYDTIMGNGPMRPLAPQVGVRINLPVRLARRDGAVVEAQARLAQLQAELARQGDQAAFEVQQAFEQLRESLRGVRLYEKEVLPAARQSVKTAQVEYVAGKIPFLSLIEAERELVGLQDRYYELVAEFFRRRVALERALTGPPGIAPAPATAPRSGAGPRGGSTGATGGM